MNAFAKAQQRYDLMTPDESETGYEVVINYTKDEIAKRISDFVFNHFELAEIEWLNSESAKALGKDEAERMFEDGLTDDWFIDQIENCNGKIWDAFLSMYASIEDAKL